jgi:MinD superfamily P-loop ATPase
MRIAVASGKGGTGKTTVATNLAWVAAQVGIPTAYLDCDVEEPNGAIFLKPSFSKRRAVGIPVPAIDPSLCSVCGDCGRLCQYSAILCLQDEVITFPELCHGCGGCALVCPTGAITERLRRTGTLAIGRAGDLDFVEGRLTVGEAMSPPVIRQVLAAAPAVDLLIVDAPPGTSCPVIESVRGADLVLLVTEPTPFGLHDLKLAVEMVRALSLPAGVVINRADLGDERTRAYCRREELAVLAEIPDDRDLAVAYSRGELASAVDPRYRHLFGTLLGEVGRTAGQLGGVRP